jgi:hypothetical protein
MVTVIDYAGRRSADGKEFFVLILMGGIEFVQSTHTGCFYATAWKSSITTTFNEQVCKGLVGKTLPGEVQRIEVEPYEFKVEDTGETIMLTHKFRFNPSPNNPSMEETVFAPELTEAKG